MRISPAKLAAVLLSCSSLWVISDIAVANLQVHCGLRQRLDAQPDTSVASIWCNPLSGRLHLRGVHTIFGRARVDIGALDLSSPVDLGLITTARAQTKPAVSGSASAENVVIVDGEMTYRIKRIDLSGTPLTSMDLLALLDPKKGVSLEARLRQLKAAMIVVSEATGDGGTSTTEHHWTQKQVTFADVQNGKAAAINAGAGSLAIKVGQDVTNFAIGALQLADADLAQIAHVLEKTGDGGEPLRPLYETAVVNAVKLTDVTNNQTLTIGSFKEQGVKARALGSETYPGGTKLADGKDTTAYRSVLDDYSRSVAARVVELDDVHATVLSSADMANITDIGLSSLILRDVGEGPKVGGLDARNLRLEGQQIRLSFASVTTGGFTVPLAAFTPQDQQTASLNLPPNTPLLDDAQVSGIAVDVQAPATATSSAQHVAFSVAKVGYAARGLVVGRPPDTGAMNVDHVTFDISPQNQASQALYLLGYRRVDMSAHLATSYVASAQTLSVDKFVIDNPGMGSIELKLDLANVAKGITSTDRAVQEASWSAVLLHDANLFVRNDGLIDKAIEFKAALDGISVPDERATLIGLVNSQLPALAEGSEKLKSVTAALTQFISAPKSLRLNLVAKTSVGAADAATMNTPQAVLDRFDISAGANE